MAGHADFTTTENYLAGFNGEQLAASANIVRNAVAKHTGNGMGILEDKITLNDNGAQQAVIEFLNKIWADAPQEKRTAKDLLIALLQQTDCQDGSKAQEYVNCFLQSREKDNMV